MHIRMTLVTSMQVTNWAPQVKKVSSHECNLQFPFLAAIACTCSFFGPDSRASLSSVTRSAGVFLLGSFRFGFCLFGSAASCLFVCFCFFVVAVHVVTVVVNVVACYCC